MRKFAPLLFVLILALMGLAFYRGLTSEEKHINTQKNNETTTSANQECSGQPVVELTEGPYYKAGSPETKSIRGNSTGETLVITGYVFDQNCEPISDAWIDFWQTDEEGNYDNNGYKFRGHQFTDQNGAYELETIVPVEYSGRTPHIHVKLRASENSPIVTSQLFVPGASQNATDSIFDESLLMSIKESPEGKRATFNFVLKID